MRAASENPRAGGRGEEHVLPEFAADHRFGVNELAQIESIDGSLQLLARQRSEPSEEIPCELVRRHARSPHSLDGRRSHSCTGLAPVRGGAPASMASSPVALRGISPPQIEHRALLLHRVNQEMALVLRIALVLRFDQTGDGQAAVDHRVHVVAKRAVVLPV